VGALRLAAPAAAAPGPQLPGAVAAAQLPTERPPGTPPAARPVDTGSPAPPALARREAGADTKKRTAAVSFAELAERGASGFAPARPDKVNRREDQPDQGRLLRRGQPSGFGSVLELPRDDTRAPPSGAPGGARKAAQTGRQGRQHPRAKEKRVNVWRRHEEAQGQPQGQHQGRGQPQGTRPGQPHGMHPSPPVGHYHGQEQGQGQGPPPAQRQAPQLPGPSGPGPRVREPVVRAPRPAPPQAVRMDFEPRPAFGPDAAPIRGGWPEGPRGAPLTIIFPPLPAPEPDFGSHRLHRSPEEPGQHFGTRPPPLLGSGYDSARSGGYSEGAEAMAADYIQQVAVRDRQLPQVVHRDRMAGAEHYAPPRAPAQHAPLADVRGYYAAASSDYGAPPGYEPRALPAPTRGDSYAAIGDGYGAPRSREQRPQPSLRYDFDAIGGDYGRR
jgi:hypothetical protein